MTQKLALLEIATNNSISPKCILDRFHLNITARLYLRKNRDIFVFKIKILIQKVNEKNYKNTD